MSLADRIDEVAAEAAIPGGEVLRVVTAEELARLAGEEGVALRSAEIEALRGDVWPLRYIRNHATCSAAAQIRLLESHVAMVGLGGLGGHLQEQFARLGVGRLRLADGDVFEEHNLNRQLLATPMTVGRPKAAAATARITLVNPAIDVEAIDAFLDEEAMDRFVSGASLVVDALGGLAYREALQRAAGRAGLPLVTGAMAGYTGYVAVVLPGKVGPAQLLGQGSAAEDRLGTPAPSVAAIASLMASQAAQLLALGESALTGKMLVMDMASGDFEKVSL
jgi:molybdopterin/thiamine biosynthesis adenylyltransferase